jgi:hypothetical protein
MRRSHRARVASAALAILASALNIPAEASEQAARLTVVGTEFRLQLPDGRVLSRSDLIGTTVDIAEAGGEQRIRIDAIEVDPEDPTGEVMLHALSVYDRKSSRWQSFCLPDAAGKRLGFPFATDPNGQRFRLTCLGGAEAKCIRMGYRPWKTISDGRSLEDHFRACIHMVRADYCGDDRPATRDGTLIHVYDLSGIQPPGGEDEGLSFEAAWGRHGAVCVARTRIPAVLTLDDLKQRCPRLASRSGTDCDEHSARDDPRALLFNKSRLRND